MTLLPLLVVASLQTTPPAEPDKAGTQAKVPFPHPLITEVLYSVPGGKSGDANKDGMRSATGDEFIELINPHDKPIELEGYRLTDGQPAGWQGRKEGKPAEKTPEAKPDAKPDSKPGAKQDDEHEYQPLELTFPKLTLQPGEVVVVFNGFESSIPGPVGDATKAASKNDQFGGAYVFSFKAVDSYQALSNQNDMVVLTAPQSAGGEAVECVRWDFRDQQPRGRGKGDDKPARPRDKFAESTAKLIENLPNARNSVQRASAAGEFTDHIDLNGSLFSPGLFGVAKPAAAPVDKDGRKPDKGPEGK